MKRYFILTLTISLFLIGCNSTPNTISTEETINEVKEPENNVEVEEKEELKSTYEDLGVKITLPENHFVTDGTPRDDVAAYLRIKNDKLRESGIGASIMISNEASVDKYTEDYEMDFFCVDHGMCDEVFDPIAFKTLFKNQKNIVTDEGQFQNFDYEYFGFGLIGADEQDKDKIIILNGRKYIVDNFSFIPSGDVWRSYMTFENDVRIEIRVYWSIDRTMDQDENLHQYDDIADEFVEKIVIEKSDQVYDVYKQWAYLNEMYRGDQNSEMFDCVGVDNGHVSFPTTDLLSTLIVNEKTRGNMNLNVYTPSYLAGIEKRVADYLGKYFFAFKVCHLKTDLDILAGVISSDDLSKEDEMCGYKSNPPCFERSYAILIAKKDDIVKIDVSEPRESDDLRLYDNTATGGEVQPCFSTLTEDGDAFKWTCFVRLCPGEAGAGSKKPGDESWLAGELLEWTFDLNGNELKKERITCD